jgi:hypothetical protein
MASTTVSPILAEVATLRPEFFSSLLAPAPSIFTGNLVPFSYQVKVDTSGGILSVDSTDLVREPLRTGWASVKLVGPFQITAIGNFGTSTVQPVGLAQAAVYDASWTEPSNGSKVTMIDDAVVVALGAMAAAQTVVLPFPSRFRDNLIIAQPAGITPKFVFTGTFAGFSSITITLRGHVHREGQLPVQPYA